jgi:small subunit ribosomal protein S4
MARYTGPGHRMCKRVKQPLCGLSCCPMNKERLQKQSNDIPDSSTHRSRALIEQQKVRYHYGLTETQLKKYLVSIQKKEGPLDDILLRMLETRFDVIYYRLGFSRSLVEAREIIELGYVKINGSKVSIVSRPIHPGDIIEVRLDTPGHDIAVVSMDDNSKQLPYLQRDDSSFSGQLLRMPEVCEIPIRVNMELVIQYYDPEFRKFGYYSTS